MEDFKKNYICICKQGLQLRCRIYAGKTTMKRQLSKDTFFFYNCCALGSSYEDRDKEEILIKQRPVQYERQIAVIQNLQMSSKRVQWWLKTALLKTVSVGGDITVIKHAIYVMGEFHSMIQGLGVTYITF